jgi:hypothetical protein
MKINYLKVNKFLCNKMLEQNSRFAIVYFYIFVSVHLLI